VRHTKAAFSQLVRDPPGNVAPSERNWSSHGGNEVAETSDTTCDFR
jgi:hypothetical protein